MGPMAVIIHRIRVTIGRVDTVAVIDEAVAVVIDTVIVTVSTISEHIVGQVRVVVVDPCVDHPYDHATTSGCFVPGLRAIDVGVRGSTIQASVMKPPLIIKTWIIGSTRRATLRPFRRLFCSRYYIVRFGVEDIGVLLVNFYSFFNREAGRQFE